MTERGNTTMSNRSDEPTYVYDNTEVSLTGRSANRDLPSGKIDTLVEITPTDQTIGTWKKWVTFKSLYKVAP